MALEEKIAELTAAVNNLIAAMRSTAADEPPAPLPVGEVAVVTMDDLRTALLHVGRDKARAILKQHGCDKLPELPIEKYAAVLRDAKAAA